MHMSSPEFFQVNNRINMSNIILYFSYISNKSMGPNDIHLRVLKEMADVVAKSLSMILKHHGNQVKSLVTGKKATPHPFLNRVKIKTMRSTNL